MNKGFTLVEILMTLFILSILIMFAVPSFYTVVKRDRLVTTANQLHNTFKYARSEAIKRNQTVTLTEDNSEWVVSVTDSGVTSELQRFRATHSSISVNLDTLKVSNTGGLSHEKTYTISDADSDTEDLNLCILLSGQSWLVEESDAC